MEKFKMSACPSCVRLECHWVRPFPTIGPCCSAQPCREAPEGLPTTHACTVLAVGHQKLSKIELGVFSAPIPFSLGL